uniref:Uncharacterized protein n=1 Tax=Arundo donax TaxID=35708 RepID=A0A0A9G9U6_ARUDO
MREVAQGRRAAAQHRRRSPSSSCAPQRAAGVAEEWREAGRVQQMRRWRCGRRQGSSSCPQRRRSGRRGRTRRSHPLVTFNQCVDLLATRLSFTSSSCSLGLSPGPYLSWPRGPARTSRRWWQLRIQRSPLAGQRQR